jgi:hypothetical protein
MMKQHIKTITLATTLSLTLIGCGGGGSDDNPTLLTGTFVDAPVQGVSYSTKTQSGTTDDKGHFKYQKGETVTFKIGTLSLGSALAKDIVTPLSLSGDTNLKTINPKALNIATLLQTLDDNPQDKSKIVIAPSLHALDIPEADFNDENTLTTIINEAKNITNKTYTLKQKDSVKNHLQDSLHKYIYQGSYTATSTFDSSKSSGTVPMQCANTLLWDVTVDQSGQFKGTSTTNGQRLAISLNLDGNKVKGIANDGTNWDININEEGTITGTYNYMSGLCVGNINGHKR